MVAHMILGMIAPIGIVLGAPITLALRTLPQGRNSDERGVRGSLLAALHSKLATFYTNPIVALAFFDGSLFALYFTGLFGSLMQSHAGHLFMNIHFLLAGQKSYSGPKARFMWEIFLQRLSLRPSCQDPGWWL